MLSWPLFPSNFVDTHGVAGSSDEDILMIKVRKKAENSVKFEIWFTNDQDVPVRLQIL